jgi:hypothetical protein
MDFAAGILYARDPFPPMTPYSPPHYTLYTVYLLTQGRGKGGELTREKVKRAIVHNPVESTNDILYLQSINPTKPVKTTFKV